MKRIAIVIILFLGFQKGINAQDDNEIFTIYLVRHAEKDFRSNDYSDLPLTECGKKRAESLCEFFKDVPLEVVYSSDFKRTKSTAMPTAKSKQLDVEVYDSYELEDFSKLLLENKQNALIVGHSYSTGVLAGLLVGEEIGAYDLSIYNRIYQVVIFKDKGQLNLFNTSFECNN